MKKGNAVLGFFLAPLAGALFIFLAALILGKASEGMWAFGLFLVVAYPTMLVLGIPIHLVLSKLKLTAFVAYFLSGAIVGVALCWVIFSSSIAQTISLNIGLDKALSPVLYASLIAAVLGGLTSFIFWGIARPDRS